MEQIIYVAINKETGKIMSGAKGQYAFGDDSTLGRSVGQAYGKGAKEKYTIKTFNVTEILNGVVLSKDEHDSLQDDSYKLSCLECCGVDNWQGFEDAMEMYRYGEDENE